MRRTYCACQPSDAAPPSPRSPRSFRHLRRRLDAAPRRRRPPTGHIGGCAERVNLVRGHTTTAIHTQSRIAAFEGSGFYTIARARGAAGALALALRPTDPAALHYRHVGTLVARQLQRGTDLEQVPSTDAYTVSTLDPVTVGVHCRLEPEHDFLVTSTLASQGLQAVGRALAIDHLPAERWPADAISYVSCGDGSINNSEWLAVKRAGPSRTGGARARRSSASRTTAWHSSRRGWSGTGLGSAWRSSAPTSSWRSSSASTDAVEHVRSSAPANPAAEQPPAASATPRPTGRAPTLGCRDRPHARSDPVALAAAAVHAGPHPPRRCSTCTTRSARWRPPLRRAEPREMPRQLIARCAPPRQAAAVATAEGGAAEGGAAAGQPGRSTMTRWAMMAAGKVLYVGEDVEHGGYYRVSEGLKASFGRRRIFDWPPDEASLVGAGIGMAQAGHVPIVEIPYAAYLSCGYNQFVEACFLHWLSDGKQPNGMLFRMQGFDEGIFGGHFHTANAPPVFGIPGLDVLASQGAIGRGMRACLDGRARRRVHAARLDGAAHAPPPAAGRRRVAVPLPRAAAAPPLPATPCCCTARRRHRRAARRARRALPPPARASPCSPTATACRRPRGARGERHRPRRHRLPAALAAVRRAAVRAARPVRHAARRRRLPRGRRLLAPAAAASGSRRAARQWRLLAPRRTTRSHGRPPSSRPPRHEALAEPRARRRRRRRPHRRGRRRPGAAAAGAGGERRWRRGAAARAVICPGRGYN